MELEGWRRTSRIGLASWIGRRLTQPTGLVCGSVPDGFQAYARICHPVPDPAGPTLTWQEVAAVTGTVAHPLMQWHALVGADSPYALSSSRWDGAAPRQGHLDSDAFHRLLAVLEAHTETADDCLCGYWVGYTRAARMTITVLWTGETGGATTGQAPSPAPSPPLRAEPDRAVDPPDRLGVLHHPGRDYELFTGPMQASTGVGWSAQSPHLFWPADRAWCVATEVDFDSTLVGGDHTLIDELLAAPGLDVWPVVPTDSLMHDADEINRDLRSSRERRTSQ